MLEWQYDYKQFIESKSQMEQLEPPLSQERRTTHRTENPVAHVVLLYTALWLACTAALLTIF